MSAQAQRLITVEEYLDAERQATHKSEFLAGEVFAMAGASPRHVLIATNVAATLHAGLKGGPCRVFTSDQRLRVPATGLHTYPDVAVVCGELEFAEGTHDTIVNPVLLVEVLSDSTRNYDRGEKFANYRTIASLVDYLLIDQHRHHVEYFSRQADGRWLLSETDDPAAVLSLVSIGFELSLEDVYYGVEEMWNEP